MAYFIVLFQLSSGIRGENFDTAVCKMILIEFLEFCGWLCLLSARSHNAITRYRPIKVSKGCSSQYSVEEIFISRFCYSIKKSSIPKIEVGLGVENWGRFLFDRSSLAARNKDENSLSFCLTKTAFEPFQRTS